MAKRKTQEQWEKEYKSLTGDEYTFLEPYQNKRTKIACKHNKCGYEWKVSPASFLKNERCSMCRYANNENKFRKKMFEKFGNEYEMLTKYQGLNMSIFVKHNICNNEYKTTPANLLYGKSCHFCNPICNLKSQAKWEEEVKSLTGNDYTFLDEYKGQKVDLHVRHNVCGNVYCVKPKNFLKGSRCLKCRRLEVTKTNEKWQAEVFELVGTEYVFLGDYINAKTKIKFQHKKCGHIGSITPHDFLKGVRCSICSSVIKSHGESDIMKWLKNNDYKYEYQKTFVNCKNKQPLPFDFYIPSIKMAIEYDGEQHFKPIDYFGGDKEFKKRIKNDKIKNQYCDDNDIFLVRIPYTITGEGLTKMLDGTIKPIIDEGGSTKMKAIFFAAPYKY